MAQYSMTTEEIIKEALDVSGIARPGQSIAPNYMTAGLHSANLVISSFIADGIGLWFKKRIYIIPGKDTTLNHIGSGNLSHVTEEYFQREIQTISLSTTDIIYVDQIDDITAGDYIGVELADETLHWTTVVLVNATPEGDGSYAITITDDLTDDTEAGAYVFNYTTKFSIRPIEIIQAARIDIEGNEYEIPLIARKTYDRLVNKDYTSIVVQAYYHNTLANGSFYTWGMNDNVRETLALTVRIPFSIVPNGIWPAEFPIEWLEPIILKTAVRLMTKYRMVVPGNSDDKMLFMRHMKTIQEMAEQEYYRIRTVDKETVSMRIRPGFKGRR